MIEAICDYIHNFFVRNVYTGTFVISGGAIDRVELLDGQYYKIIGSVLNDGVHLKGDELQDETFKGQVWAMGVPPALIALADEIDEWIDKYGDAINSPYQSESFGGYSYSKATVSGENHGGVGTAGWQSVFANRLNQYRKINSDFSLMR